MAEQAQSGAEESAATIFVAIAVNILIAACKVTAAVITGSSAMLSESIHSCVDALNEALLFVGVTRGKRPPDAAHPLGHGQELYFWTLIVAVVIFGAGGSVSIFEGVDRMLHPRPLERAVWSYAVLGASLALEAVSWVVAYRALRRRAGHTSTWRIIRESKDPTIFTVLLEDSAALVGLLIALIGTIAQQRGLLLADGTASIGIGSVLCCVAFIVIRESRGLLVGERAASQVEDGIRRILAAETGVERIDDLVTLHLGPDNVLLLVSLAFVPRAQADTAQTLAKLSERITTEFPVIKTLALSFSSLGPIPLPDDGPERTY